MHYQESKSILEKIKKAKKILLALHSSPDGDSASSNLALSFALQQLGKNDITIISSDAIPANLKFLPGSEVIQINDITKVDLSPFDLFISVDSQQLSVITNTFDEVVLPKNLTVLVIDHHRNNKSFGHVNLLDDTSPATAEMLYLLFEDIGISIDKNIANALLAGIIDDTGAFKFPSTTARTLQIASSLIAKGGDKDEAILHLIFSRKLPELKFWAKALELLEVDETHRFAWVSFPYETYGKINMPPGGSGDFATMFLQCIADTDFAFIVTEREKGVVSLSLRSRTGLDVSKIATEVGGGGHRDAAGARFKGDFDESMKKILEIARKHANKKEADSGPKPE
jgi:bifunctional oligoribonuclease and PAP phosphatase NrnA